MFKKYMVTTYPHELLAALKEFDALKLGNSRVFMAARDYQDIRAFYRDELDMCSCRDEMRNGKMADLGRTALIVSRLVPKGVCYMVSETESTTMQMLCMLPEGPLVAEENETNFKRLVDVWDKAGEEVAPVVG